LFVANKKKAKAGAHGRRKGGQNTEVKWYDDKMCLKKKRGNWAVKGLFQKGTQSMVPKEGGVSPALAGKNTIPGGG